MSIQVFNIGTVAKDSLQLYFEHTRSSGGGEIKHFTMNERHRYAVIKFRDPRGHYLIFSSVMVIKDFNIKQS